MAATRCLEEISYRQLPPRVWISSERYRMEITRLGDNSRQVVIKVLRGMNSLMKIADRKKRQELQFWV